MSRCKYTKRKGSLCIYGGVTAQVSEWSPSFTQDMSGSCSSQEPSCQSRAEGLVFLFHGLDSSSRRPHLAPDRPARLNPTPAQTLKCGRGVFFKRTRVQTARSIKWCSRAPWRRTHLSAASVDTLELLPGATITGKLWLSGRKCTRKEQ